MKLGTHYKISINEELQTFKSFPLTIYQLCTVLFKVLMFLLKFGDVEKSFKFSINSNLFLRIKIVL